VLCGHQDTVTCVTIVTELDMAVSGSRVKSLVVYDVRRVKVTNIKADR